MPLPPPAAKMRMDNRDAARNPLANHAFAMNDALRGDLIEMGLEGAVSALEGYGVITFGIFAALDADDFTNMRLLPAQRKALTKWHGLIVGGGHGPLKDNATDNSKGEQTPNRRAGRKTIAAILAGGVDGKGDDNRCLSRSQSGENCNESRGNSEMRNLTKSHSDSELFMDGKSASEADTYGCTFKYGFRGSFAEVATHVCSEEGDAGAGDSMFENKHVRKQEEGNIGERGGRRSSDNSEGRSVKKGGTGSAETGEVFENLESLVRESKVRREFLQEFSVSIRVLFYFCGSHVHCFLVCLSQNWFAAAQIRVSKNDICPKNGLGSRKGRA